MQRFKLPGLGSVKSWHADLRGMLALLVSPSLLANTVACERRLEAPRPPLQPVVYRPLEAALEKSYEELFETAPRLEFSRPQIERMRDFQKEAEEYCTGRFRARAKQLDEELREAQAELKRRSAELSDEARKTLHCRIQNLRAEKSNTELMARSAIPVAYQNRVAKLDLIEQWPTQLGRIRREIETGSYHSRRYGDVKDIGFREVGRGQEEDVRTGREAIEEMRRAGLMPPAIENKAVQKYVTDLAEKIARRSDLRVPVRVTVLNSKEMNALALPGGYLFVQRGLLEAAEDESQLAGVLAHEIAHAAARHGHRLMRKATVASIVYQAAQVAALVLTGGAAGIGTYYALQYGFYGLGLVLGLDLLGVSREFELEADQLGVQYAWKAGYDPKGFIRFFDKMATREGQREILLLPKKDNLAVQTPEFQRMKRELEKVTKAAAEEEEGRPSLLAPEEGCPEPPKIDYKPGERIESVCSFPPVT